MSAGPRDFGGYITPEKAVAQGDTRSLEELRELARSRGECIVCGEPIWKFAGCDMCFPCTTGEADASEDYEIVESNSAIPVKRWVPVATVPKRTKSQKRNAQRRRAERRNQSAVPQPTTSPPGTAQSARFVTWLSLAGTFAPPDSSGTS